MPPRPKRKDSDDEDEAARGPAASHDYIPRAPVDDSSEDEDEAEDEDPTIQVFFSPLF